MKVDPMKKLKLSCLLLLDFILIHASLIGKIIDSHVDMIKNSIQYNQLCENMRNQT
ncbi:hypothetical protein AALP_AA8G278300 [Arabis alpina]|uniref:Uncharacterized protein n=1 Tax=Arabis alpina TaxID=50452 RepID=A0A087G9X2_ARAAL|nr:hypothetical protein AALP_AA8G278300 [Arabis alpina]